VREGKALPIAAGEQEINVSVTIRWAIDNRRVDPFDLPIRPILPRPVRPLDSVDCPPEGEAVMNRY
jgi:hypothetical protein